jgi:N-acetyltransferase
MASSIRRTYSSRHSLAQRSSSPSDLSSPPPKNTAVKRVHDSLSSSQNSRTAKRLRSLLSSPISLASLAPCDNDYKQQKTPLTSTNTKKRSNGDDRTTARVNIGAKKKSTPSLTQLHFSLDTSSTILRTCAKCALTYTKGAPADESLHRAHCARVRRGAEWGREEERDAQKAGVVQIASAVKLKDGRKGRIVAVRADVGGKVGSKASRHLCLHT